MNPAAIRVDRLTLVKAAHPLTVRATVTVAQPRGEKVYSCVLSCDERKLTSLFAVTIQAGSVPRRYRQRVQGRVYDAVDQLLSDLQERGKAQ